MQIKNSTILITGASGGIGFALAIEAAKRGAHLHLQGRKFAETQKSFLLNSGAPSIRFWTVDFSLREEVENFLGDLKDTPIDILINNAGQLTGGLIENQSLDEIYSMFQVNLMAVIQLTQGLLPKMLKQKKGKVVNNSSVSSVMHFPCASTYAASKAAVVAFTNCIEAELRGTGVSTLTLITPGVKTEMFDDIALKYGKNLETPKDAVSPEKYAVDVCNAIEADKRVLLPKNATRIGLILATYVPGLFNRAVATRFHR